MTKEDIHLVYQPKKSLYGLKQAPRMGYEKFDSHNWQLGYHQSDFNPCMYVGDISNESRIYLILYMGDTLIAGHDRA